MYVCMYVCMYAYIIHTYIHSFGRPLLSLTYMKTLGHKVGGPAYYRMVVVRLHNKEDKRQLFRHLYAGF